MILPTKCHLCGGEVLEKTVEKVLRGGNNTAVITTQAGVCLKCGEHLYEPEAIKRFEEIREKLREDSLEGFKVIGRTFSV